MTSEIRSGRSPRHVLLAAAATMVAVVVAAGVVPAAHAQMAKARVDEMLTGFLSITDKKCAENKDNPWVSNLKAQGKTAEAFQAETAIHTLCVCMPGRVRALLKKMPASEREARLSEQEFTPIYLQRVVSPCAADALKATYGTGCADRMAPFRPNTAKYCSCMAGRLDELSDAEIGQMASDNADYLPLAAAAKQKGQPLPKRPPSLERMKGFDEQCAAK